MTKLSFLLVVVFAISVSSTFIDINKWHNRLDTRMQILREGYPCEVHTVTTPDGYILKLFRIPHSPRGPPPPVNETRPVVYLMHGLLMSSSDWVVLGKENSIAFLLSDAGYDVWMGNARGNTYSRFHTYLNPDASEFWDFSWHEIGEIDNPTMIDFVLMKTNQTSLHYVGHSQGTTSFFVMASIHPEMNAKIKTMHALAPVAFMGNDKSPPIVLNKAFGVIESKFLKLINVNEFLPSDALMIDLGKALCYEQSPFADLCAQPLFLLGGYDSKLWNKSVMPEILENLPAGSSAGQIMHYVQNAGSGKFQMYDYGLENLQKYGQLSPPEYNLTAVTAPVYLHYSNNDWFSAIEDVILLSTRISNTAGMFFMPFQDWNHFDYMYAIGLKKLCLDNLIAVIKANT